MNKYRKSIFFTALIISIPSLFLIYVGVVKMSLGHLTFWIGIFSLWWGIYFYLLKNGKHSFWMSFFLVNIFWWPLLWRTGERVFFVIENGNMERADGSGSPMAFLIGLIGEQLFFLPLSIAIIFGLLVIKDFNKKAQ